MTKSVAYGRESSRGFNKWPEKHFGEKVVNIRNNHKLLGMNMNITEAKQVEIDIKEKLLGVIDKFGENIDEKVTTLADSHLFIANKQARQVDEINRKIFHLVVAKILYIKKKRNLIQKQRYHSYAIGYKKRRG